MDGTLYFWANNGTAGRELVKSDGTTSGTALAKDIDPGNENPAGPNPVAQITLDIHVPATILLLHEIDYGSLQETHIIRLKDLIICVAKEHALPYVILDLSRVRRLGARLLGTLVGVARSLRNEGRSLVLCGDRWGLTGITRVDQGLPVHATVGAACRWCTNHGQQRLRPPADSQPAPDIAPLTLPPALLQGPLPIAYGAGT